MTFLTADDLYYFNEGRHFRLYDCLGAHFVPDKGYHFAVWAPNAHAVSVIGDFNGWNDEQNKLSPLGSSGIWVGHALAAHSGDRYKYRIISKYDGQAIEKADPFAFGAEMPPKTASVIQTFDYQWGDDDWMNRRKDRQKHDQPISIYEVHLGSWRRKVEEGNRPLSYRELAEQLVTYVKEMGYTHVEIMPIMEHPFGGSWGYQVVSYYAPTRRYGDPQDFMYLIDRFHQEGIGVILDWVPSHFATDAHGLGLFDGTSLYEHADPRQGFHPDWGSYVFNYSRKEVQSFLISNALYWLDKYHIDGLRVDAVASMLYLDYSRKDDDWIPNEDGGRENYAALHFIRELNVAVHQNYPDVQMIAEESTAWPGVSKPVDYGGLGFGFKWDMGWMHDTLKYFGRDPLHRSYHQDDLTFRSLYAFHENFILAVSHDEVVHGKGSLLNKMSGLDEEKFANLRCLLSYLYALPGKKLMFMGCEFGQWHEWNHTNSLDWHILEHIRHKQIQTLVRDLNAIYRNEAGLYLDCTENGFQWIDVSDKEKSIFCFLRRHPEKKQSILCVCNLTPVTRHNYRIGVPQSGTWQEIFNSDHSRYGGTGTINCEVRTENIFYHQNNQSLNVNLPGLSVMFFKWNGL